MASSVATSSDASSSLSSSSNASPSSSSSPSIDDLSAAFVQSFYEALATHPDSLYAFYHENATSVRYVDDHSSSRRSHANGLATDNDSSASEESGDGDGEGAGGPVSSWSSVNCVHGQIEIDRVAGLISRCRVRVDTLNSTQDRNTNTVHILVTGVLLRGRTPRSFSHSFILLNDGEAYSISSDILRLYPLHAAHHLIPSSTPSNAVGTIPSTSSLTDANPAAVSAAVVDTNAVLSPSSAVSSTPLDVRKSPAVSALAHPSTPSIKADVHENDQDHEHLQATPSSERRGKKRHEPATDAELAAAGIEEEPTVIDVERQILPHVSELESPKSLPNGDATSAVVEEVASKTAPSVVEPVVVASKVSNHNQNINATAVSAAAAAPVATRLVSATPAEPVVHVPVKPSSWASLIANKTAQQQPAVSAAPVAALAAVPSTTPSSSSLTPSATSTVSSSPSEPLQQTLVSVSNIPTNVSRPDIHTFFSRFGPVQQIHFNDGTPSEATVHFVHSHDAVKVLQFQTQSLLLGGSQLSIAPLVVSVPPPDHHHRQQQNGNPHVFRSGRGGGRPRPPPRDSPNSNSNSTSSNNDGVDADGFVTQGRRRKNNNSSNIDDQRGSGRPARGDFGRGPSRPRPAPSSAPKH